MIDDLLTAIFNTTFSLNQLKHRLRILREYLSYKLFGGNTPNLTQKDTQFLNSLPADFLSAFNQGNLNEVFSQISDRINSTSPLTLYLAFEPTDEALEAIGQKARSLFGKDLILDIKSDPHLLAGAAMSWKGVYRDYSLKSKIEEKKQEILQSFKKFLR